MEIKWDNGEVWKMDVSHEGVNKIADFLLSLVFSGGVTKVDRIWEAGDVQCGAGDVQCGPIEPHGYMKAELKQHGGYNNVYTVEVYVPYYFRNPLEKPDAKK